MKGIPKTIYLQVGDDWESADHFDEDEVTWCVDKIHSTDIEYVLAEERLSQTEPEPDYWLGYEINGVRQAYIEKPFDSAKPLYTAPPKREWVGLTEDDVAQAMYKADAIFTGPMQFNFAKAIEAKLKEKNT